MAVPEPYRMAAAAMSLELRWSCMVAASMQYERAGRIHRSR